VTVTIKDIARLAKVSHTTVSRALNNSPLINDKTKNRIKQMADELNYTPNVNAKSLVTLRSFNIGLFFSTLSTGTSASFFFDVVRGVNMVIKDQYNLVVKSIDEFESNFNRISSRQYDGIIVMSQTRADRALIEHAMSKGIPVVLLNRAAGDLVVGNILSDDHKGAYQLVEYIIRCGHRHVAIIEGREGFQSTIQRRNGYLEALKDHGIEPNPELCIQGKYDVGSGYEAMCLLLKRTMRPSAVFCCNDDMAVGAIKAIIEADLRVPEDISIAGFDDNVFAAYLSPELTTVKRPIEQISREGAAMIMRMIESKQLKEHSKVAVEHITIESELVIRKSIARISAAGKVGR
jgi:LacI family transcriptional regulator